MDIVNFKLIKIYNGVYYTVANPHDEMLESTAAYLINDAILKSVRLLIGLNCAREDTAIAKNVGLVTLMSDYDIDNVFYVLSQWSMERMDYYTFKFNESEFSCFTICFDDIVDSPILEHQEGEDSVSDMGHSDVSEENADKFSVDSDRSVCNLQENLSNANEEDDLVSVFPEAPVQLTPFSDSTGSPLTCIGCSFKTELAPCTIQ
jgi:hypothetical protein